MRASLAWASALSIGLATMSFATGAHALEGPDTAYGRIDGDVSASGAIGTTFGARGPRAALDLRLRYLWTAGVFVTYEDGPLLGSAAEPRRALATGIELRPLFFGKW